MSDLANMTDYDGRVNGSRLLRWLRSRAEMELEQEREHLHAGGVAGRDWHAGRRNLLDEMADDLEVELTPPDCSEDDGDEPERPCPNCQGTGCVVRNEPDGGQSGLVCQACNGTGEDCTVDGDGVDLDDPAFLGRPEQE